MTPDFDDLDHERFMREALKEAELALQQGERPIGAVIVHNGKVIGRGRAQHQKRKSKIAHASTQKSHPCQNGVALLLPCRAGTTSQKSRAVRAFSIVM